MAPMKASWLVLVVVVYVSLDVANPLIPGALSFGIEDCVEARQADRFRAHGDRAAVALPPLPGRFAPVTAPVARMRAPATPQWRQVPVTRSHPPSLVPAPSPEDH
jgi:hypothetical protein